VQQLCFVQFLRMKNGVKYEENDECQDDVWWFSMGKLVVLKHLALAKCLTSNFSCNMRLYILEFGGISSIFPQSKELKKVTYFFWPDIASKVSPRSFQLSDLIFSFSLKNNPAMSCSVKNATNLSVCKPPKQNYSSLKNCNTKYFCQTGPLWLKILKLAISR